MCWDKGARPRACGDPLGEHCGVKATNVAQEAKTGLAYVGVVRELKGDRALDEGLALLPEGLEASAVGEPPCLRLPQGEAHGG